jgi:hypothetical protein
VLGELLGATVQYQARMSRVQTPTLGTWWMALESALERNSQVLPLTLMALALPAWALLTYWTMMIFGTSMHIAKVNPSHVARCIIYCLDVCVWCGLFVAVVAMLPVWELGLRREMLVWAAWATATSVIVFAYRMCRAYRLYMRFDHPITTVLATQIIVGLLVINVVLFWLVSRWSG